MVSVQIIVYWKRVQDSSFRPAGKARVKFYRIVDRANLLSRLAALEG